MKKWEGNFYLKDCKGDCIHHWKQEPHSGGQIESTPEDHLVLEEVIALLGLVIPSLVSIIVDDEPPAHLHKLASNDVLYDPEVDARKHKHQNIGQSVGEHDREEEVPKEMLVELAIRDDNLH